MTTTVVTTDIISIGAKVKWFRAKVMDSIRKGFVLPSEAADVKVVEELLTMIKESRSCNHTSTRGVNRYGYERTPSDWSGIPTTIEQMNLGFSGSHDSTLRLRSNPVVSVMMSDALCMIETAMSYERDDIKPRAMVFGNVSSGRHMGTIKMMFDILTVVSSTYTNLSLHMCIKPNLEHISDALLGGDQMIHRYVNTHWSDVVDGIMSDDREGKIIVSVPRLESPTEFETLMSYKDVLVSTVVSMTPPVVMQPLAKAMVQNKMVGEMVVMSDPSECEVRIRSSMWNTNSPRVTTMFRHPIEHTTAMVNALIRTIRPMNLNHMCYDCRMVSMIAYSMANMYKEPNPEFEVEEETHWSGSYAETITVDTTEYENPI